jgi:DNA-binding transcriptional regulator GbsR (MarR family)
MSTPAEEIREGLMERWGLPLLEVQQDNGQLYGLLYLSPKFYSW